VFHDSFIFLPGLNELHCSLSIHTLVSKRKHGSNVKPDWWDKEVREVVEEKKKAWLEVLALSVNQTMNTSGAQNICQVENVKEKYRMYKRKVKECVERKKE
jgi:hypothetical protein